MRWFLALFLMGAPAFAGPLPQADAVFAEPDMDQVRLGWHLFYDPILSGNRTVACATCHHPRFATGDGLSLGLGDGGIGIGPARRADPDNPPEQLIPRNAPALFNLGASEFDTMFHDGRLEADPSQPGGIRTPLGQEMVAGFSGVLSAQVDVPGSVARRDGRALQRKRDFQGGPDGPADRRGRRLGSAVRPYRGDPGLSGRIRRRDRRGASR